MTRTARRVATATALALALALVPAAAQARTPNYAWQMYHETNQSRVHHSMGRLARAYRLTEAATTTCPSDGPPRRSLPFLRPESLRRAVPGVGRERRLHDRRRRRSAAGIHEEPLAPKQRVESWLQARGRRVGHRRPRPPLRHTVLLHLSDASGGTTDQPAKSSGVTVSRNSRNFSTSSSSSSGIRIEASSRTSSCTKIGTDMRTASASASEGREEIS